MSKPIDTVDPTSHGRRDASAAADGTRVVASLPERVYRLPTAIPFALPPANATFLDGEVPTLIDCGVKTDDGWGSLQAEAAKVGVRIDDIERIVMTHAHLDHAGNARRIQEETGAEVWIHEDDAQVLREWDTIRHVRNEEYMAGYVRAGLPEPLRRRLTENVDVGDRMMDEVPELRTLRDGDTFVAGDRTLRVLHTPGHTPGSACYLDPTDGLMVTGDTILQWITPNALQVREKESGALGTYMATLHKLRDADLDVTTMIPGHGPAFSGLLPTIDRCFRLYEERRHRFVGFLEQATSGLTAWDIVTKEWPEDPGKVAFLGTSEVLGHLGVLVAEGLVGHGEPGNGGAVRYALAA